MNYDYSMTLEERYESVLSRVPAIMLTQLPASVKVALKRTTDLKQKVELLEKIADLIEEVTDILSK